MLLNEHLKRICEAILNDTIENEKFGNLIVEAGVRLDDKEWDITNNLLKKSDEISHVVGGRETRIVH